MEVWHRVINSGKVRYDLLPTDMADELRRLDKFGRGWYSPSKIEHEMTKKFGPPKDLPPVNEVPRSRGGVPDPDEDLKPK